jgi:hypothetical protein
METLLKISSFNLRAENNFILGCGFPKINFLLGLTLLIYFIS